MTICKEWHQRGIFYIQDLFDNNGISCICLSFETFSIEFTIRTNFLRYFGVINTIKNTLSKEQLFQDISLFNSLVLNFDSNIFSGNTCARINISIAKSEVYYNMLMNSIKKERPVGAGHWIRNYDVEENLVFHGLSLSKGCTKESKLLSMQYFIV